MDNEFLLMDRIQKIQQVIGKYGEENFYLSFSGGRDSTVLSALLDMALPGNTIPRVYANTGIEYQLILDFVERERERTRLGTRHYQTVCTDQTYARKRGLSV
jgi:3'-phosphoadenosine 5'-phosphosulfate sulfotransferase (PAPS reductase)/FAD synthetase